jgi:hypothetical protein
MNKANNTNVPLPNAMDGRGVSQMIFVAVTLAITIGGIWSLYMADAPYHPEISRLDSGILFASN